MVVLRKRGLEELLVLPSKGQYESEAQKVCAHLLDLVQRVLLVDVQKREMIGDLLEHVDEAEDEVRPVGTAALPEREWPAEAVDPSTGARVVGLQDDLDVRQLQ